MGRESMSGGIEKMHDDEREAAEKEYFAKLEAMPLYVKNLIVSSAWYVVRTFEDGKSTIHQQSAALELLKEHLKRHTR
jgi:hypothetical protein